MKKLKIYVTPSMEILACTVQNLLRVASDEPDDPGILPAPRRRTEVF